MEKKYDIRIDGNVATWELNKVGAINGTYIGTFKFRCYLTPMQKIAAGKEERDLLGSNIALAPEHERFMAYSLTQLKYRIIQSPPFWTSANTSSMEGDLPDEEIISEILDAAISAEIQYKKELKEKKEKAIERAKSSAEAIEKEEEGLANEDEDQESGD